MWRRLFALALWLSLVVALHLQSAAIVVAQNTVAPAEAAPAAVRARCLSCHGVDLIDQQRLSRVGWERELDKMIRWGALVSDAERAPILDALQQLSARGRPLDAVREEEVARGASVFEQRCLRCHRADLVEQQRLTPAGWRREIDKMIGWGARVDDADRDALLTYLSGRYGVR